MKNEEWLAPLRSSFYILHLFILHIPELFHKFADAIIKSRGKKQGLKVTSYQANIHHPPLNGANYRFLFFLPCCCTEEKN